MKNFSLINLILIIFLNSSFGQGKDNVFSSANQLFDQYKFKESVAAYQKIFTNTNIKCESSNTSNALYRYGQALIYTKDSSGHEILSLAEQCAVSMGNDSLYVAYLSDHAGVYRVQHEYKKAKPYYWTIKGVSQLSPNVKARNFAQLALICREEQNDSTEYYAKKAIEIAYKTQDTISIIDSYTALGIKKRASNKYHDAISWNQEALKFQQGGFAKRRSETFASLASLFTTIHDYSKAKKYVDSVYQSIDTSLYKSFGASVIYTEGLILKNQNQQNEAIDKFKKSISGLNNFNDKLKAKIALIECYADIGNKSKTKKELTKTISEIENTAQSRYQSKLLYLKALLAILNSENSKAIELAKVGLTIKPNNLIQNSEAEFHEILAETYEKKGELKKSLYHYKRYYSIKDSIKNSSDNSLVYALENEFTAVEQDKQLSKLETTNALQDVTFEQQKWKGIALLGFLCLLGLSFISLIAQRKKIKRQTATIKNTLEEKNILLKEIHHRVKNNLQVITSLFKLQTRYVDDHSAANALNEGRDRVNSLAILHQNLYQENNLKGVRMDNYIEQLCDTLFANNKSAHKNIVYKNHSENLILDIDTVIPLGLILTELLSFSLKNEYQHEGVISVFLSEVNNQLKLEVVNNGTPPVNKEAVQAKNSFSEKIIQAFSKKLKASYSLEQNELNRHIVFVNSSAFPQPIAQK